jgi:transposase
MNHHRSFMNNHSEPTLLFALTPQEREALEKLLSPLSLTTEARRAQALLWLDQGTSTQAVAVHLHVSRQTVYNWVTRFLEQRSALDICSRLADKKRPGRPQRLPKIIDPLIAEAIERGPGEFGYHSTFWSVKLLAHHLREAHHIAVNRTSIRLALGRLGRQ